MKIPTLWFLSVFDGLTFIIIEQKTLQQQIWSTGYFNGNYISGIKSLCQVKSKNGFIEYEYFFCIK
jgi:hypothetical protein